MGKMDIMDNMDIQILRQAARTQGTPAYVFDLDAFARRIRHMKKVLGQDIKILYAMKANPFFTLSLIHISMCIRDRPCDSSYIRWAWDS